VTRKNIIIGQKVTEQKAQRARELRQKMTPAERRLWQQLRANRLDNWHFRRQQIIDGFIVDFYCHRAGLVIEVDGPIHEDQQEADAEREAILRTRELTILRFTNRQVMNDMPTVLQEIRRVLNAG
jgi:very-short-patch-repair endonuclease